MWFWNIATVALFIGVASSAVVPDDDVMVDRFIELHRARLLKDTPATELEVTLLTQPADVKDTKDDKNWTFDKVTSLLILLQDSRAASSVNKVVREALRSAKNEERDAKHLRNNYEGTSPVMHVKNHLQAQLPGSEIRLQTIIDMLVPKIFHSDKNPSGTSVKTIPRPAIPPVNFAGPMQGMGKHKLREGGSGDGNGGGSGDGSGNR